MARRDRAGTPAGQGLVHHSDAGSQYTSFAFTAHLAEAGIDASIGTVGDALDNALMESQIGLYKTELIKPRKPWHGLADVELGTAERVDWFNNQRLHTAIGDIPPHEHETNHYAQLQPQPAAGVNAYSLHRSRSGSLSALAAQDDELQRLRRQLSTISPTAGVVPLPRR